MKDNLRNQLLELLNNKGADYKQLQKLINDVIALINPKVRVYYNFSISDFKSLVANTDIEGMFEVLKSLDPHKQYSIYDYAGLEGFLDYLKEEAEEAQDPRKAHEQLELYNHINSTVKKINNNLYIYVMGELNPKHWI